MGKDFESYAGYYVFMIYRSHDTIYTCDLAKLSGNSCDFKLSNLNFKST